RPTTSMNKDSSSTNPSAFERTPGGAIRRIGVWALLAWSVLALRAPSVAADEPPPDVKRACLAVHKEAQVHKREGRLLAAREALLQCKKEACPSVIRTDCGDWLAEVERLTPSIILSARTKGGDESDVRVLMDGKLIATRLDGKSIPVDPGEHNFRFEL